MRMFLVQAWNCNLLLLVLVHHQLLRAIHSLWSPPVSQSLPGEIKAAMIMSEVEQTSLLGEVNPKMSKNVLGFIDGSQIETNKEYAESHETDVRNWLKGVRDSGYVYDFSIL